MVRVLPALIALATLALLPVNSVRAADAAAESAEPVKLMASDLKGLSDAMGKEAIVEGEVTRVGSTEKKGITFLNFGNERGSFVGVIFMPDYGQFPGGFDKYKGKTLRLKGTITVFRDSVPQIVLKTADQIEVVE